MSSNDPASSLRVIHLAIAGGVVLFAAVVFGWVGPGPAEQDRDLFRWVWLILAIGALFGAGVVRTRMTGPGSRPEKRRSAAIIIWALAEGQVLLGLVGYLVTGDVVPGAIGILVFLYLWTRHRPSSFFETEGLSDR
ncbi:MAG: hypothetical protein ACE5HP_11115 [Gemmatimonadota bacterium]